MSAFDHYIAVKMFEMVPCRHSFASKIWLQHHAMRPHPLNDLLHGAFKLLFVDETGQQPSDFFKQCQVFDNKTKRLYYAMPEEMSARAFEHMLQLQQFQNSFLVSGCLTGPAAKAGLYPSRALSKALAESWLTYFSQLGQLLQMKQPTLR